MEAFSTRTGLALFSEIDIEDRIDCAFEGVEFWQFRFLLALVAGSFGDVTLSCVFAWSGIIGVIL